MVLGPARITIALCCILIALPSTVPLFGLSNGASAQEDEPGGVLRIGFLQEVDDLNPLIGYNDAAYVFYGLVYDYPHCLGNDLEVLGNIATDTRAVPLDDPEMISSGRPFGSVWEYTMTKNARWHDGEPFTVDDFVWNVDLQITYFDSMWAFQPYSYFMESVRKVDDDKARIYYFDPTTGEPMPCAYAYLLAIPMLPRHMMSGMNPYFLSFSWNGVFEDSDPQIVGTGPFTADGDVLGEWIAGDSITLVRNPNYHWRVDKGLEVRFDKVKMMFYDDATSMRLALTSGDLDIAHFPPDTYKAMVDAIQSGQYGSINTYAGPKITQYWTQICFSMYEGGPNPSRLDVAVRQALAMATNKTYIVNQYYAGLAEEGSTLIPPVNTLWHYEPSESEKFVYDLDAAGQKLDEAGYLYPTPTSAYRVATSSSWAVREKLVPEGKPLFYEMMVRREYPEERLIAKYLQETWAEIGVGVEVIVVDESYMGTITASYEYDSCIWYWSADIDPNFMLYCQTKASWYGWSENRYFNPAYDENFTASVRTMDYEDRKVHVDNCQRIHYNDCAYIIMACPYQTYAWRTDTFEGWGDWDADPGRSMDNFWSGNPLWYDLEYVGGVSGGFDVSGALMTVAVAGAFIASVVLLWKFGKRRKKTGPLGE